MKNRQSSLSNDFSEPQAAHQRQKRRSRSDHGGGRKILLGFAIKY